MSATEALVRLAARRQTVVLAALGLAAAAQPGPAADPHDAPLPDATASIAAEPVDPCLPGGGTQTRTRPAVFSHGPSEQTEGWRQPAWAASDVEVSWDERGQPVIRNVSCDAVQLTAAYGQLHHVVIEARCAPGDVRQMPVEPMPSGCGNSHYPIVLSQGESVSLPSDGLSSTCETEPIPIDVRYVLLGVTGERVESPWRRTPVCGDLIPSPGGAAIDVVP